MSQRSAKMNRRMDKYDRRLDLMEKRWFDAVMMERDNSASFNLQLERLRNERRREAENRCKWNSVNRFLLGVLLGLSAAVVAVLLAKAAPAEAAAAELPHIDAAPVVCEIIQEQPEEAENQRIEDALMDRAHKLEGVKITHYCACRKCCGKPSNHPAYGITASGRRATPGVSVAVDPDLIPLGSTVMVDYGTGDLVYYRADDTGAAIKGAHIDVFMDDHQQALEAGVKTATVWWCEE